MGTSTPALLAFFPFSPHSPPHQPPSLPCLATLPFPPFCPLLCSPEQAKFGDDATKQMAERRRQEAAVAATGEDANLIPLGKRAELAPAEEPQAPIPEVEWWDGRILADKSSYGAVIEGEPAQVGWAWTARRE